MSEVIPVTVYVAHGQLQANVVKTRLESEGIPVVLQYESLGIVFGLTLSELGDVKVMVPETMEAQARAILEEFDLEIEEDDEDDEDSDGQDEDTAAEDEEDDEDNEDRLKP